jgi:hypothetical protein
LESFRYRKDTIPGWVLTELMLNCWKANKE